MSNPHVEADTHIASLRPSVRRLIGPAVVFVVALGMTLWLTGVFTETWQTVLILVASLVLVVVGAVVPTLSWLARKTTISTRKLVLQCGVRVRVRRELLHARGYDVVVRRTPGQRLFRCGDLHITATGSDEVIELVDIPNPVLVQSVLHDLVVESGGTIHSLAAGSDTQRTDATKRFDPNLLDDTQAM